MEASQGTGWGKGQSQAALPTTKIRLCGCVPSESRQETLAFSLEIFLTPPDVYSKYT